MDTNLKVTETPTESSFADIIAGDNVINIPLFQREYKWTNKIMAHELKCLNIVTTKCDKNTIYNPEICVICLDDFKENESISELECKHSYHSQCINEWIVKMPICPYCKN